MPEYAFVLLIIFLSAFFIHRHYKLKLFRSRKQAVSIFTIFLLVGIIWDHFAISRGHWSFGDRFLLGPKIGLMPIEELGFIIIMAYFGFVIYKLFDRSS